MKSKGANKKEDFIEYLDTLIAATVKEGDKQKRKNKTKGSSELLTMLEAIRNFTIDIGSFYLQADVNKILTWEQVSTCIIFITDVIIYPYVGEKEKQIEIDNNILRKFLALVYEKKYWGKDEWVPYVLTDNLNILLLFYFPDNVLREIKLPHKTVAIINDSLFHVCRFSHIYKILILLKGLYKKPEFLTEMNAFCTILDFISAPKALEYFNKKNNRLITWEECNNLLERELKFIENVCDKNNWKIAPNKKYTDEMFEFVNQKRLEGLKCYVAYQNALEEFGLPQEKEDSFRKQYNAYLKKGK